MPLPTWERFAADHSDVSEPELRGIYQQAQMMDEARQRYTGNSEDVARYINRRAIPIVSTAMNLLESSAHHEAQARIASGTAHHADFDIAARRELDERAAHSRSLSEEVLSGATHLPAMAGEAVMGGSLLRGASAVPYIGGALRAIGVGKEAAPILSDAGGFSARALASNLPGMVGRNAATAAVMPSMWAPQWTEANERAGRDPLDPRAIPSAYAMGFLNTAVLGSLGGAGNAITRRGVAGAAARVLTRTGTGMLEQQGVDVLASAVSEYLPEVYKLNTGYGIGGAILRGNGDEALRHALTQAVTFGAFSVMHEFQTPHAASQELKEVLHEAKEAGLPPQEAAKAIAEHYQNMQKLHEEHEHLAAQGPEPGIDSTQGQQTPPPTPDRIPIPREALEGIAKVLGIKTKIGRKPLTDVQLAKEIENSGGGKFLRDEEARLNPPKDTETIPQPKNEQPISQQPPSAVPTSPEASPGAEAASVGQTVPDAVAGQSGSPVGQETAPVEAPKTEVVPWVESRTKPTDLPGMWKNHFAEPTEQSRQAINEKAGLTDKEATVMWARLPKEQGGQGLTQEQVADLIGISSKTKNRRERPRQIEQAALKKAQFEVSAAEFKKQVDGLTQEGRGTRGETKPGELGRVDESLTPSEILTDALTKILQDTEGRPFTDNARKALEQNYLTLLRKVENAKRTAKHTVEQFEQRLLAGIEVGETSQPDAKAGNRPGQITPSASQEPQGQTTRPPGPLEANQGQGGGTSAAGTGQPIPATEAVGGAAQGTGRPPVEPRMPEGMGAAGVGQQAPAPPPGTPGTAAPIVAEPPPHAPQSEISKWWSFLKSFANQTFPAITSKSQKSGEALASASNAPASSKTTWEYLSRILKAGGKSIADMNVEERRLIGAAWGERRMREYRETLRPEVDQFRKDALNALAKHGATSKEALEANERYADAKAEMEAIGTFVGQQGSPFPNEKAYQDAHDSLWSFWQAVRQEWTPLVDKNFKQIMGLDPNDVPNTKSQIPGLPLNMIPIKEGDNPVNFVGTGKRQGFENQRLKRPGFTRKAELNSPAYDVDIAHMMQRTLDTGIPAARRAEAIRTMIDEGIVKTVKGVEKAPEGWKFLNLDPAKGMPDLPSDSRYYAHPEAFNEIVQGLGIGERPGQRFGEMVKPIMDKLYSVALMSPVELSTHIANHMTALFRPGMGIPLVNLKDSFSNAWQLWKGDPAMHEKVMKLAEMSAAFGHEPTPGILGGKWGENPGGTTWGAIQSKDPTALINKWTSKFIDTMQKAVRIQLGDAYNTLQRSGDVPKSDTSKRDFINQALGNYNNHANNWVAQFLKDSGLQSFATAAHTFTVQGAKAAFGGAINTPATSHAKAAEMRAIAIVKLLPFLAMGPVINAIVWGKAFPENVPAFAIKTRDDQDGGVNYFDQLAFTGIRRGWKITGQNASIEAMTGANGRQTATQIANQTVRDAEFSLMHLVEGPPVDFMHTLMTGENRYGHQMTPRVPHGEESFKLGANVQAAVQNLNPLIGSLTEADRPRTSRDWIGRVMPSLGPFGERRREAR